MTFDKTYWAKADVGMPYSVQQIFNYLKIDETLATIVASAYFNTLAGGDNFRKYDLINIQASDDVGIYQVSSETNATPVTVVSIIDASIIPAGAIMNSHVNASALIAWSKMALLTEGNLLLGDASNVAVVTDFSTDTQIGVGDGTTFASVAMSGDATLANTGALTIAALAVDNGKVSASAAIAYSKLAALTEGNILLGDNSNVAVVTDFSTDTQIGVGNGTTFASVAMSGDATLANTGALTIAALAIDNSKVATAAAIAWTKMAALTEGNLLLGDNSNVAVVTDFSTDTQIGVGNGTTFASVAMSGDATLANTGALTVAALAIDNGKLAALAVDNAKVATAAAIAYSKLAALTEGNILLGDNSNVAVVTDFSTDTQIGVGNGTTFASVAVSGDATLANTGALTVAALAIDNGKLAALAVDNAKVATAAAIAWSKMAALTEGNLLLGDNSNVAVVTDFSTNAQIGVGDGTTFNSVAMSGDIAIDNAGATTIQASAVDESMISPNTLTGLVAADVADANVIGGLPQIFRIATAGGATANTDVTVTHKIRVIDVWVVNTGLGTAGDTIQVFNGANNITDAIDINNADMTIGRTITIDDSYHEIAPAGTLRVTETDGGGTDSPSTVVYVSAIRVA